MSSSVGCVLKCRNSTFAPDKIMLLYQDWKLQRTRAVVGAATCCLSLSWVPDFPGVGRGGRYSCPIVGSGWSTFLLFPGPEDHLSIARLLFSSSLLLPGPLVSLSPVGLFIPSQTLRSLLVAPEWVCFALRCQTHVSCWTAQKPMSQMCTAGLWQASYTASCSPPQETVPLIQSETPRL